jgi:hypothetical protein
MINKPIVLVTKNDVNNENDGSAGAVQIDGPFVTGKDQDASELVIQKILGQIP